MTPARFARAATALASAVLLTVACSHDSGSGDAGGAAGADTELKLAMNVYSRTLPYFQDMIRGVQDVAREDGHTTVDVTYGDTNPQLQYDQLENALSTSPNGLLIVPVNPSALIPVIQQAATNGVAVVTMANDIDEAGHASQIAHVGQEYVDLGRQKAQYLIDALGGRGTVGYIHGIRGLTFSERQSEGAKEVFAKNSGITLIDGPYAGEFSSDAGLTATENVLTAHPDINALYFDNDDIALGGILAVQQRNRPMDSIYIIGTDGGAPALEAIGNKTMDMTISLCGYATGRQGAQVLIDYLRENKKPADRFVQVETLTITSENLADSQKKINDGQC